MKLHLTVTPRQMAFLQADADEVLFGGAAGGGKSYAQLTDAMLYALRYPKSKQLLLRRTLPELEMSLIRVARGLYPTALFSYQSSLHCGSFVNGSVIDFGYCASEGDVYRYQSAEYDVIRFDELTHFTEFQYLYLLSRLRGANGYPKQVKSATNPGGVGHSWVKRRFVSPSPWNVPFVGAEGNTRVFLPAKLSDNPFLCRADPGYRARLEQLPDNQKKALLYGEWDLFEGQFFSEFAYETHTVEPFAIPAHWRRFRTVDYGLDCLACLWVALDGEGNAYVYRELCRENLVVSQACEMMLSMTPPDERIYATLAPPDLWQRSQESGRSKALLFSEFGVSFTKTPNDRETGWLAVKELLRPQKDGRPRLRIFRTCTRLIECLPALQHDPLKPCDTATEPHDITHAPDALRGFAIYYARPATPDRDRAPLFPFGDMAQDYENATPAEREYLRRKWQTHRP